MERVVCKMKTKMIIILTFLIGSFYMISNLFMYFLAKGLISGLTLESAATSNFNYQFGVRLFSAGLICTVLAAIIIGVIINKLFNNLEAFREKITRISDGQLAVRIGEEGIFGLLGKNVNKIVKNIKKILSEIAEVSETNRALAGTIQINTGHTERASEEIAESVMSIAENANNQSIGAISAGESAKLMAEDTKKIVDYAVKTQTVAEEMMEVIKDNGEVFNSLISKLKKTGEMSEMLAVDVQQLQGEADKINSITAVVTEISERTNLLALNAAIEAARAGEQGRGFSVVADEVRKLAEQSSDSAGEIRKLIENITKSISDITLKTKNQVSEIEEDIKYADSSKESYSKIIDSTKLTCEAINEIQALASDTSNMTSSVSKLVEEIVLSTQEAVAFTEEVSAAAEEQSASMQEMSKLVVNMEKAADGMDDRLNVYINNIIIGDGERKIVKEGFKVLNEISSNINSKALDIDKVSALLAEMVKTYPQFEYIGVMDGNGIMKSANVSIDVSNSDFSFRPYFKQAILGKEFISDPYISGVTYNYCIAIAMCLKDKMGNIIGVIMGDVCVEH